MVQMKHAADTRKPYSGLSRSLVIAIDVGTTFSGVSYAILEPGEIPKILGVTRFPGQEHVAGNSKIPSIIYYDRDGNIMAAGAMADSSAMAAQAEDEGWIKAELFKLRLRPRTMQLNMNGMRLSPLPRGKTPVHVFGDYLGYLYTCTRSFIMDTHANGSALWASVENDIQFVLSHPNGWEGPQQTRMRKAAVYGRLVPDTDEGRARIRFVTEGEASLHACVLSGLAADVLSNPSKHGFLIADAGGGTLDISAYAIKGTSPLAMEEIAPPDCIFAGSVFVSRRAREFLEEKLKHSKYGASDSIDHITRRFDETTKRLFRDRHDLQFIPFGSPLDKDSTVGIRSGQLRLSGNEVANLFEPSVDAAVTSIKRQIEASNGMIRSVFLVGGYAASPWLFGQLQERLRPFDITVSRPDTQTSKAVADGAIGFYCDHHVSARMSKFMYGVEFLREVDPKDPDHVARSEKLCELPSGPRLLPDAFDCILARSIRVKESTVFTRKYCTELTSLSMLSVFEVEIWCYRGGNTVPKWINRHDEAFSTLCVVQADLSLLSGSAEPKVSSKGKKYWTIVFSVEIHFGLTEFKARIKWMDNGTVKYGPAVIVYNERGSRLEDDDMDLYPEDDGPPNGGRYDKQREPSSRARTPVESPYPGGASSRRTSAAPTPEMPRMERTSSKGYSPSLAPSHRTGHSSRHDQPRGSDGDRGSDSDRIKGKERERSSTYGDRDRERSVGGNSGSGTPIERTRTSGYGGSTSVSRAPSTHGGQPDMLSSNWNANAGVSSRSPSVKQQSRSPSVYAGHQGEMPSPKDVASTPKSPLEDRLSRSATPKLATPVIPDLPQPSPHIERPPSDQPVENAYDRPKSIINPDSGSGVVPEAIYDRPKSIFDAVHDRPTSVFAQEAAFDRPKSPFIHEPHTAIGRSASPFVDRPKSIIENSFGADRPKSAFGNTPSPLFGDHQPAMFGDSGPAANIGHIDTKSPLFGESPSMFGEQPPSAFDTPAATGWGFSGTPAASTGSLTPGKKGKRKSAAATPVAPISPAISAKKSPLGQVVDMGTVDIAAAPPTQGSPAAGADQWSPLNPAAQVQEHNADTFNWGNNGTNETFGADSGWGTAGGATDNWGFTDSQPPEQNEIKVPSRVPSRVPTPVQPTPVEEVPPTPVDEVKETASSKKKKKKAGAAATAKADEDEKKKKEEADKREKEEQEKRLQEEQEKLERELAALEAEEQAAKEKAEVERRAEEERKAEEERQAEQVRLQAEEEARFRAEEEARFKAEEEERFKAEEEARKEREENEKKEQEERERREKEEADRLAKEKEEKEKLEQEQKEKELKEQQEKEEAEKKAKESSSLFGNTTSLFGTTGEGGGDDSWNTGGSLGWGATVATTGKKKKGKAATTNPLTSGFTQPSAFGSTTSAFGFGSAGTGWGMGASLGEELGNSATAASPKLSPKVASTELPASTDVGFSFDSPAADLGFSFGAKPASKAPSRAPSPAPEAAAETKAPSKAPSRAPSPAPPATPADAAEDPPAENAADDLAALLEGGDGEGEEEDGGFGAPVASGKKKKKKGKGGAADDTPAATPAATPVIESAPEPAGAGGGAGKKKKKKK